MDDDLLGVFAVSRACLREGAALQCAEVWCTLQAGEMTIHSKQHGSRDTVILGAQTGCRQYHTPLHQFIKYCLNNVIKKCFFFVDLRRSEKCILLEFAERSVTGTNGPCLKT